MTLSILTALQSVAAAWVQTRSSLFGLLASKRDFTELDRVFRRLTMISLAVMLVGSCFVVSAVATLEWLHGMDEPGRTRFPVLALRIADVVSPRLIGSVPTAAFCAALLLQNLGNAFGTYVRAHKRDPFLIANIVSSSVCAALVWFLTSRYGVDGAAWAMFLAISTTMLPFNMILWARFRRERDGLQPPRLITRSARALPEADEGP